MSKICDNKSVGIIIKKGSSFAIIKRKNFPVSFALVAGHLDGDTARQAAIKEMWQEVHLSANKLQCILEKKFLNPCKREGGTFHAWSIWKAVKWSGTPKAGSDAKEFAFKTPSQLRALAEKTRSFSKQSGISLDNENVGRFTEYVVNEPQWQKKPGLEPIWVLILEELKIL